MWYYFQSINHYKWIFLEIIYLFLVESGDYDIVSAGSCVFLMMYCSIIFHSVRTLPVLRDGTVDNCFFFEFDDKLDAFYVSYWPVIFIDLYWLAETETGMEMVFEWE